MQAYLLSMTLQGTQSPVWRRLVVPIDATFSELAQILKIAAGYIFDHTWEFLFDEIKARITNDEELLQQAKVIQKRKEELKSHQDQQGEKQSGQKDIKIDVAVANAIEVPIAPLLDKYPDFQFLYDFTDEWIWQMHVIEKLDVMTAPSLRDGLGTAPFENVGGFGGYYEILESITKESPEAEALRKWIFEQGHSFFDQENVEEKLTTLGYACKNGGK